MRVGTLTGMQVAREAEVKAQIKLKFRNVNGRSMVCTRSMMLTQKKATVSQKTLEGVLLTKDPETGEVGSGESDKQRAMNLTCSLLV